MGIVLENNTNRSDPMQLNVQPKNTKLGLIYNVSLPAIETCNGMTESCAGEDGKCYVLKLYKRYPNVEISHKTQLANVNEALANGDILELPNKVKNTDIFRLHVSGDFFSPQYAYAWFKLITDNPTIEFFAYTRSWRIAEMIKPLHDIGELPNMKLLLSVDRDTGYPDTAIWQGYRTAFMMVTDADADLVEPDTHIVFRDSRYAVLKQVNGCLVCPVENGASSIHTTCRKCQWCFRKEPNKTALKVGV